MCLYEVTKKKIIYSSSAERVLNKYEFFRLFCSIKYSTVQVCDATEASFVFFCRVHKKIIPQLFFFFFF